MIRKLNFNSSNLQYLYKKKSVPNGNMAENLKKYWSEKNKNCFAIVPISKLECN